MQINIVEKSITPTFIFDKLYISSMTVVPYVKAVLYIQLHINDNNTGILSPEQCTLFRTIEMTTEEYNAWDTDDYIVNFVLTKLNLTKKQ